jgi:hypothetical protein
MKGGPPTKTDRQERTPEWRTVFQLAGSSIRLYEYIRGENPMAKEDEKLDRLIADIADLKYKLQHFHEYIVGVAEIAGIFKWFWTALVCADPHGTWNGHLDGAFSEGEQIKNLLVSRFYSVALKRHPVSKDEFLTNLNKRIVHLAGHGSHSGGQVYFCFDDGNVYPGDVSAASSAPTTLLYAGTCFSGWNDTMANAFRAKGTDCYVGFTQSIPDWDAKHFGDLVYEKWLVDGQDLSTALDEADDTYPGMNCWVLWD